MKDEQRRVYLVATWKRTAHKKSLKIEASAATENETENEIGEEKTVGQALSLHCTVRLIIAVSTLFM